MPPLSVPAWLERAAASFEKVPATVRVELGRALTMLAFVLIAVTWSPVPFFAPALLAEDGSVFYADALHRGVSSIMHPFALNFHVLERALAYLGTFFPTAWVPAFFAWAALLLGARAATTVVADGFEWLHDARIVRAGVALLFAWTPGSNTYGALCNLAYVGGAWLFLLALRDVPRRSALELCGWALLGMSTPFVAVAFLAVALLATVLKRRALIAPLLMLTIPVLLLVVSALWDPFTPGPCHPGDPPAHVWRVEQGLGLQPALIGLERAVIHFFLMPLVGGAWTSALMTTSTLFWALALLCCGFLLWWGRKHPLWWIVVIAASLTFSLAVLGRPYTLEILLRSKAHTCWDARYAFIPGVLSILLWTHVASRAVTGRLRALLGLGLVACVTLNLLASYHLPFRREDPLDYTALGARIDAQRAAMRAGTLPIPQTTEPIPSEPPYWGAFSITIYHP